MINRGKTQKFQTDQLVRVLDDSRFKLYNFGMNKKREIVYLSTHDYLTRDELSIVLELTHILAQAVELKHVVIHELGPEKITQNRLRRARWKEELEEIANGWHTAGREVTLTPARGSDSSPVT